VADAGFRVTGRVQGVGYRWWTRSLGTRLALSGTVRNREDGTVEVHARGSAEALAELRRRLHDGPPLARVDAVEPIPFDSSDVVEGEFTAIH
jgi:acylphosphatase